MASVAAAVAAVGCRFSAACSPCYSRRANELTRITVPFHVRWLRITVAMCRLGDTNVTRKTIEMACIGTIATITAKLNSSSRGRVTKAGIRRTTCSTDKEIWRNKSIECRSLLGVYFPVFIIHNTNTYRCIKLWEGTYNSFIELEELSCWMTYPKIYFS